MNQNPAEGGGNTRSNLGQRFISALVLGVAVLGITVLGGFAFRIFAGLLGIVILSEWMAMRPATDSSHRMLVWIAFIASMVVLAQGVAAPLTLAVLAVVALVVLVYGTASGNGAWAGFGVVYAGVPVVALAAMRGDDAAGLVAILFLFAIVWATDILAYFVGRAAGGPKLAPSISPGKTWSGAAGGAIGAIVAGAAAAWLGSAALSLLTMCVLALVLSAVSQLGDLFESALKRRHGVKDSSALIPGHGGVMDRVDGLVAAAVAFYFTGVVISGFAAPAAGFFSR